MGGADDWGWDEVEQLPAGGHIHLDELIAAPPAPGSERWLPIIAELTRFLVGLGGHWMVSLPLGVCPGRPLGPITIDEALVLEGRVNQLEPPAVYRLGSPVGATWHGQKDTWNRRTGEDVIEIVSISQSDDEAGASEGWTVQVSYEVGRPT